jgi:hypothetical protein
LATVATVNVVTDAFHRNSEAEDFGLHARNETVEFRTTA